MGGGMMRRPADMPEQIAKILSVIGWIVIVATIAKIWTL